MLHRQGKALEGQLSRGHCLRSAVAGQALTLSTSFTTLLNLINLTSLHIAGQSSQSRPDTSAVLASLFHSWVASSLLLPGHEFCTRGLFLKHRLHHMTPYLKSIWVERIK